MGLLTERETVDMIGAGFYYVATVEKRLSVFSVESISAALKAGWDRCCR